LFYENTWVRTATTILFLAIFIFGMSLSIFNNSSHHLIKVLTERGFPFEMILLEGASGLSKPERERIQDVRYSIAGLGMYFLTGVNISDARTYFLSYYAPPKQGLPWLGWAYYPHDPEMEGPILEMLDNPFYTEPVPSTSEDDVLVGIYHTHNAESYAGDGVSEREISGENGYVVKVGQALAEELNSIGIKTIHSDQVNDTIYNESYDNSFEVAQNMLEENPTIRILLDVHRDGLPPQVGKSIVRIGDMDTAKILIVLGQNNPTWERNDQVANSIIEVAEDSYPGFFSNMIRYASKARYNQHLTNGAILLEVGSQLNTAEEAMNTVQPLAEVLKEYLER